MQSALWGNAAFAGSANIDQGVIIDLCSLAYISVAPDRTGTLVGSGATWGQIYAALDPMNLTVVGGRVPPVGLGGLLLGGET